MHRITLELDDESYAGVTHTAQSDGVTLEEWLTGRVRDLLAGYPLPPALFLLGNVRCSETAAASLTAASMMSSFPSPGITRARHNLAR